MTGSCKLNNKSMRNVRREQVYQCLVIDLHLLGKISKEECERLIGGGVPAGLFLPEAIKPQVVQPKKEEPKTEPAETEADGE